MQLNDIVNVNITAETAAVSQAGFGLALILGAAASGVFDPNEYVREYSNVADMITDGFVATDREYLQALQLKSQEKIPTRFLVGVLSAPAKDVSVLTYVGTLTAGSVSLKMNYVTYTQAFDTDQDTTMTALAVLIAANPTIATAVWDDGAQTMTLESTEGDPTSYKSIDLADFTSIARTFTTQSSAVAADLVNVDNTNSDWYALLMTSEARDDIFAGTAEAASRKKFFGYDIYDESETVGAEETDLAFIAKANADSRALHMYKQDRDKYYLASWFGRMLPEIPGSANWAFKTLSGVPVYSITSGQQTAISDKYGNMYEVIGGVNVPFEGRLPDGSWADILRGSDWLSARIQEAVYSVLVNSPKVPYTDRGFVTIESAIYAVLRLGVTNKLLIDDDFLKVTMPKLADISASDKANRHLPDVIFTAHLQGAVNTVTINGTLTLP